METGTEKIVNAARFESKERCGVLQLVLISE
jgi:hypothetical protein